jgi:uncharacterized small protein (DUF1192 family)
MSAGELGVDVLILGVDELRRRIDQVEQAAQRRDQVIADCVMRLAQSVDELRGRVALLAQVEGVIAGRRVS